MKMKLITLHLTRFDGSRTVRLEATGDPESIRAVWYTGFRMIDGPDWVTPADVQTLEREGWSPDESYGPALVSTFLRWVGLGFRMLPDDGLSFADVATPTTKGA